MIKISLFFGFLVFLLTAAFRMLVDRSEKEENVSHMYQIEMFKSTSDVSPVSRVLDWRVGM